MHCTKFPCRSKNVRAALGAELGASSITQAKQIINLSLLNHFYPVVSYRRVKKKKKGKGKGKRRITVYGSVTRYGPQLAASASG